MEPDARGADIHIAERAGMGCRSPAKIVNVMSHTGTTIAGLPSTHALQPVLVPVVTNAALRTAAHVAAQRSASRLALAECARGLGLPVDGWLQDARGVPLPRDGWHWSVSHKRHWAAAVIADRPVGIDIEHVVPRPRFCYEALAGEDEWERLSRLAERSGAAARRVDDAETSAEGVWRGRGSADLPERPMEHFYRLWTAKEAVLKACGSGIGELRLCRLAAVHNAHFMTVEYRDHSYLVEHWGFADHIVGLTCGTL